MIQIDSEPRSAWSRPALVIMAVLLAALPRCGAGADTLPPGGRATAEPMAEHILTVAPAAGDRTRALLAAPPHPAGTIVMFSGGNGHVGIGPDGAIRHDANFVVRTRALWVASGYAVLIPDAPPEVDLRGRRSSPRYAAVGAALIAAAHAAFNAPVFVLGTSQGAIAAANAASQAGEGAVAGLILSEAVSRSGISHETVFSVDLHGVRAPALIVANRDDRCDVAPPADAARIAGALRHATVVMVSGGITHSVRPCGSLSPHGYDGIERQVVGKIVEWIKDQR